MFRDIKNDPNSATREIENKALIMFSHNIEEKWIIYCHYFIEKKFKNQGRLLFCIKI